MKGWGKDPFLASLSAVELCGPCRFGGWTEDGFPIAVMHPAPWIQVAAVSRDQTRNTMTLFPGLFSKDTIAEYGVDMGKEIIYARGTGRIESVTSSPKALEGGRPTLVVANETHHWLANNEGLEMAEAIRRNLGKSRDGAGRVMEITNAHLPGEGSVAELTYEAWRAASGKLAGVYYDSTEAPPIEDFNDIDAIRIGLLAARGDSSWVDVDRVLDEILDPINPESVSRRFYLNQVTAAGALWIPDEAWDACKEKVEIPDHEQVVLGFDGSYNYDTTALVVVTVGEKPYVDVVDLWSRPPNAPAEWSVPIEEVEDKIRACCRKWKVREVVCDSYRWARSIQILEAERLPMVDFPQRAENMMPATERFHAAVMSGGMTHSGDEDLALHVSNAVLKTDSRGSRIVKDHKGSPRKIDLAVAAVMAFHRASQLKKRRGGVVNLNAVLANA